MKEGCPHFLIHYSLGSREFRHLLYGNRAHVHRIIYGVDEREKAVTVLHIRHGARDAFAPEWAK